MAGRREDWPGAEVELLARAGAGQAPRWNCWPGQVLAGAPWRRAIGKMMARVPRRSAIWKMMARVPRRSAIWKMMAGALWRRGWRGAVAKRHREATAGGSANAAASGRDCWPGRCGRARPPVQNSKGGQCDQRTASISAQIAGERTASVLCADCRRRGLEFEGDFCQEVDLCLRIYALPAEVFRTIYKVVLAIPSVRVVLFVEEVVYNSGEGNAGAAL